MDRPLHKNNTLFKMRSTDFCQWMGSHNTRELGGYKTTDGKSVKWGMLFRSDKLSDISDTDQEYLQNLGIKKIVDFRSEEEKLKIQTLFPQE